MSILRSERASATLLLVAAVCGLVAANSVIGPAVLRLQGTHLAIPGTTLNLSVEHWISDGLLAIFFFVVAVELKHELTAGELNSLPKAIRPAIAAVGGVIVPILIYLAFTAGSGYAKGWPIPTATDIAFALGVLAVFGKGIPARLRIFLLALAILDDVIAIIIIAVFFTAAPNLLMLGVAVLAVVAFAVLGRLLGTRSRVLVAILMGVLAVAIWYVVYLSGVHATIAGVALGLAMPHRPALRTRHILEPFSNGVVLPLFAFSAALVAIPQVPITELAAPFWGILVALPVGKLIGIVLGGWLSTVLGPKDAHPHLSFSSLLTAGALGGIGFTVSLLMNQLAFAGSPEVVAEGTLAVLLGSTISIVLSGILVSREAAHYRRLRRLRIAARQPRQS
ncbi:MAG: Na+/H+ antiporter NhaA [Microbacteriaceae bacterium]